MKAVYLKSNGQAHDLRLVPEGYLPSTGEIIIDGIEALPSLDSLHDPATGLTLARTAAVDMVNAKAEEVRLRFITGGATQAMVYIQKAAQAQAYAAAGYAGPVPPLVQSEATATGATARVAADSILGQVTACLTVAVQVDELRRKCKVDTDASGTIAAMESARDTALAALDAIHP